MADRTQGPDSTPSEPGRSGSSWTQPEGAADSAAEARPTADRVGRYAVLDEIGRGGMGRVLRAYDPQLQREVALKEVRSEVLGPDAAQRLVAEARAMAMLSHPNVVEVYDVEETDGRIVIVMEYVAGRTLRAWLREGHPWAEVVAHFREAGRGLAAAHAAGLLHRDFKPANVLVADGVIKVTDFGLAKLGGHGSETVSHDGSMLDATASSPVLGSEGLTEVGIVLGTPRYMAPEQHMGRPLAATADQYSFCVALWEALAGQPPFSGKSMAEAKTAGPPAWTGPPVPGPVIDAIRRGLWADPRDRWPDMEALLDALAYDPGRRRRAWGLALVGVTVAALAIASWRQWPGTPSPCTDDSARAHLSVVWGEARRTAVHDAVLAVEASYAAAAWERIARTLDDYTADWVDMHVQTCRATTVDAEQSSHVLDLRMACLDRARTELGAVTQTLAEVDAESLPETDEILSGLRPLTRCADVEALQAQVEPPLPREAEGVAAVRERLALAWAAVRAGRYERARREVDAATTMAGELTYGPLEAEIALADASVLEHAGDYAAAEATLSQALRAASLWGQRSQMQSAAAQLAYVVGTRQQRFEEGLRHAELGLELADGDAKRESVIRGHIGSIRLAQGDYAAAEAEHRHAIALREAATSDPLELATAHSNLVTVLNKQGRYEEAEQEYRRILALRTEALGPDHPDVAASQNNLATTLYLRGDYPEAERAYRRALAGWEGILSSDHPDVATARNNLAAALQAQGKYEEAEAEHRRALAVRLQALGPDHPSVATSRNNLAVVLQALDRDDEALEQLRLAHEIWVATLGTEHPKVATSHNNLALLLDHLGRDVEAEAEYRRAVHLRETLLDDDHPDLAQARHNLALFLFDRGRVDEARPLAEAAYLHSRRDDIPVDARASAAFLLARTLWPEDTPEAHTRAREAAERARDVYAAAGRDDDVARVDRWLRAHPAPSVSR